MGNKKTKGRIKLPEIVAIFLVILLVAYVVILLVFSGNNAAYLKSAFKYFLSVFSFGGAYHEFAVLGLPFVGAFLVFWASVVVALICLIYFIKNKRGRAVIGVIDLLLGAAILDFSICFYQGNSAKISGRVLSGPTTVAVCAVILVVFLAFLFGVVGLLAAFKDEAVRVVGEAAAEAAKELEEEEPVRKPEPQPEPEPEPEPEAEPEPEPEPEPVEEEPVEEPVEEEPVEEAETEEGGAARKIERVPFADKVRKADRDLKNKYDELRQYLALYGLKSRISVDGDSYRLHKVLYVQITIAGKKMKVYYKLNPNDYLTSPIPVRDASKVKKYADIPAQLDVRSDLSVKRAKELIDTVMENAGIEKEEE